MEKFKIGNIPAIVFGEASEKAYLYIHGKYGGKEEAESFAEIACPRGYQVLGFDLPEHGERKNETGVFDPWHAVPECRRILAEAKRRWARLCVRADSIGAYFALLGFAGEEIDRCLFVSPILDMEKLILGMMDRSGVTEARLQEERMVRTASGETLSWEYVRYVREHRITRWEALTHILYGTMDELTDRPTLDAFAEKHRCKLSVMEGGEHWFHTPRQLEVLERWTRDALEG